MRLLFNIIYKHENYYKIKKKKEIKKKIKKKKMYIRKDKSKTEEKIFPNINTKYYIVL